MTIRASQLSHDNKFLKSMYIACFLHTRHNGLILASLLSCPPSSISFMDVIGISGNFQDKEYNQPSTIVFGKNMPVQKIGACWISAVHLPLLKEIIECLEMNDLFKSERNLWP